MNIHRRGRRGGHDPNVSPKASPSPKAKAGNENQCVWVVSQSTGREAPHSVLTVVELVCEGERQLGMPRGAARRTFYLSEEGKMLYMSVRVSMG